MNTLQERKDWIKNIRSYQSVQLKIIRVEFRGILGVFNFFEQRAILAHQKSLQGKEIKHWG